MGVGAGLKSPTPTGRDISAEVMPRGARQQAALVAFAESLGGRNGDSG